MAEALHRFATSGVPDHPGRLRVAYLGHSAAVSGAEIALLRMLTAMHDVEPVVGLAEDGPLVGRMRAAGITVEVVPLPRRTAEVRRGAVTAGVPAVTGAWDTAQYAARLAGWLRDHGVALVHTNSLKAHFYGGLAARLAGLPQVWHARDRAADDYLPRPAVRLVRAAARRLPDAVVANSATTLATLPGVRDGTVVHDAAGTRASTRPRNTGVPSATGDARRWGAHEPAEPPLRVGVIGRLAPWKGQDVFLRAFARAFAATDARAVVVGAALFGEDAWARELHALAAELGVADRVEFTGHVDDVGRQLERLDVLVHCSTIPEPFGQVVVEGMEAGVPVIAAAAGGPAEIVDHGVSGLLTPPGDVAGLALALQRLAADPLLRRVLAAGGRQASEAYRPERVADAVTDVYDRVLSRRGHAPTLGPRAAASPMARRVA